ncbi:MAG: hypothetical protein R3C18_26210 [Planctomycetaceae bacterium]
MTKLEIEPLTSNFRREHHLNFGIGLKGAQPPPSLILFWVSRVGFYVTINPYCFHSSLDELLLKVFHRAFEESEDQYFGIWFFGPHTIQELK